jgi:RNA polymerase sigma-70 factor (ECF subfamily)
MADERDEFLTLMQRIRDGSEEAVHEFLREYGHHVRRVVRRKLDRRLRSKYDSTDFTQDIWASFFARDVDRPFDDPEALVKFLVRLASHKIMDGTRGAMAVQKRDVRREESLEARTEDGAEEVRGPVPTPSQIAVAREEWDRMLAALAPHEQRILLLLRQGYSQREVALKENVTSRTVRRLVERLGLKHLP